MPDAVTDVITVDFRCRGRVQASLIRVQRRLSRGIFAELVAMAYNVTSAAEVAIVIMDDGKPGAITSNHDVAKKLSRITKRPVVYVDVPENMARVSMRELGMPASLIEGLLESQWTSARGGCAVPAALRRLQG